MDLKGNEAIACKEAVREDGEGGRVRRIKEKLEEDLKRIAEKKACDNSYIRTFEEIKAAGDSFPTISQLLSEITNMKETIKFLQDINMDQAAKIQNMKPIPYIKSLINDLNLCRIKLMGSN